ncbi:MAG: tRNA pseudouridine(55) synthase TruB [Gallionella sp.]|nr:tRNA pseudouridine(55) synthase TruB [Gallionella sp.]MDP1940774.1 tRNA pseudouridine(55) synthase TruB [Gallionella sp.]
MLTKNKPQYRSKWRSIDGVLLFDKPLELSSNDALQKIRRLFQAEKAGHTGTLDPLATGLLPVCFGEATKFSNALLDADKSYTALLRLGQTTTTGDAEGEIIAEHPVESTLSDVEVALTRFLGEIEQMPPMHSALKHQGKPLYEYIRKGITIERPLRTVLIHELVLNRFAGNEMEISVRCSKGTYVRTLAEDIGAVLGCGAHLIGLRRTAIAHFKLADGYNFEQLNEMGDAARDACVLPLASLMPDTPKLQLDAVQIKRLAQGQRLGLDTGLPDGKLGLYGPDGFVGVGLQQGRRVAPVRLISSVAQQAAKVNSTDNYVVEQ